MNGKGGITIEDGVEAMDYIVGEGNEFNLKNLTNLTKYKESNPTPIELDPEDENLENCMLVITEKVNKTKAAKLRAESSYATYTDDQKTLFLYNLKIKFFSAAKSARLAGISERTAQDWAKRLKKEPDWDIYEKQTNRLIRPRSQLQEEQKKHIIELYDEKPYTTTAEAVESLTETFAGFNLKKSTVNNFILYDCNLSMKKLTRRPVARNDTTRIEARYEWVLKRSATDMDYMKNCIFIDESAFDINMRPSLGRSARNTPAVAETHVTRAETHIILGAVSTIDIDDIVTSRGYRVICLPPYLPELNPIEQFWAVVKNSVKRSKFDTTEDLHTRIAEACNNIPQNTLRNCIQHSVNVFSKCLNKEPV
ncbi:hypothetical protein MFLAVUS_009618 [Mucor flavus]|uniref:Tc1-like transposase DDE domain-containing protein n=1 Tax=Mucor flavus TaxID=439312 RepID=A0ABP9ZAI9_9FUNG